MKTSRDGFILHELVMNMLITLLLLGGLFAFLRTGISSSQVTTTRAILNRSANYSLHQIVELLLPAGQATLSPANAPLGSGFIDFRSPASVGPTGIVWGNTTRIAWEPDPADPADGKDNDGDGLIDEGIVVVHRNFGLANEQKTTIATGVSRLLEGELPNGADDNGNGLQDEPGLVFERLADGSVRIRLTLQSFRQNTLFSRTVETTVVPRN